MARTTPTVVNALGCTTVVFSLSAALQLKLKNNVAFVAKNFDIEGVTIDSATTVDVKSWFIIPGLSITACVNANIKLDNTVTVTAKAAVLFYSPGCIASDRSIIRGQIYAGTTTIGSSTSVDYVQIGLPGTSLDGTPIATATVATMGERTSLREVAG